MLWIDYAVFGMILIGGFVFTRAEILFVALLVALSPRGSSTAVAESRLTHRL